MGNGVTSLQRFRTSGEMMRGARMSAPLLHADWSSDRDAHLIERAPDEVDRNDEEASRQQRGERCTGIGRHAHREFYGKQAE